MIDKISGWYFDNSINILPEWVKNKNCPKGQGVLTMRKKVFIALAMVFAVLFATAAMADQKEFEKKKVASIGPFDNGKADLKLPLILQINDFISFLKMHPNVALSISGYADKAGGNSKMNLHLAKTRAENVQRFIQRAVPGVKIAGIKGLAYNPAGGNEVSYRHVTIIAYGLKGVTPEDIIATFDKAFKDNTEKLDNLELKINGLANNPHFFEIEAGQKKIQIGVVYIMIILTATIFIYLIFKPKVRSSKVKAIKRDDFAQYVSGLYFNGKEYSVEVRKNDNGIFSAPFMCLRGGEPIAMDSFGAFKDLKSDIKGAFKQAEAYRKNQKDTPSGSAVFFCHLITDLTNYLASSGETEISFQTLAGFEFATSVVDDKDPNKNVTTSIWKFDDGSVTSTIQEPVKSTGSRAVQ